MAGPGSAKTQFKKGVSGNPGGRTALPVTVREAQSQSHEKFIATMLKMGEMTQEQLQAVMKDKKTKNFQIIFGRLIYECQKGNIPAMKLMFDRLWGSVKEVDPATIEVNAINIRPLQNVSSEQLKAILEGK